MFFIYYLFRPILASRAVIAFLTSLGSAFEHFFLINCAKRISYVMAPFVDEPDDRCCYICSHFAYEPPDEFEYDMGDEWWFNVRKGEKIELGWKEDVILLEGAGQGIWEDNIYSLSCYLAGEVDPSSGQDYPERGIYKPWNYKIEKYDDFSLPLDIDKINEALDKRFKRDFRIMKRNEEEYLNCNNVNLDDYIPEYSGPYALYDENVSCRVRELIDRWGGTRVAFLDLAGKCGDAKAKNFICLIYAKY